MKVLRLIVASEIPYVLNMLSQVTDVTFDDRRVIDIPIRTNEQFLAAIILQEKFKNENLSSVLRNGPNAVCVYGATLIDI